MLDRLGRLCLQHCRKLAWLSILYKNTPWQCEGGQIETSTITSLTVNTVQKRSVTMWGWTNRNWSHQQPDCQYCTKTLHDNVRLDKTKLVPSAAWLSILYKNTPWQCEVWQNETSPISSLSKERPLMAAFLDPMVHFFYLLIYSYFASRIWNTFPV